MRISACTDGFVLDESVIVLDILSAREEALGEKPVWETGVDEERSAEFVAWLIELRASLCSLWFGDSKGVSFGR